MAATREQLLSALRLATKAEDKAASILIARQLEAIDREAETAKPTVDPNALVDSAGKIGAGEIVKEGLKTGSTETLAGIKALGESVYQYATGGPDAEFLPILGKNFQENQKAAQDFLQSWGIYDAPQFPEAAYRQAASESGLLGELGYAATKAAADPLAVASPLLKGAATLGKGVAVGAPLTSLAGTTLGTAGRVGQGSLTSALSGVGGELGGQIGEQIAGPEGGIVGALLGGGLTPSLTAPLSSGVVDAGVSAASGVKKAVTGVSGDEGAKYSSKIAQNLLKEIAVESKGADNIENIVSEFDKISNIVGVDGYPLIVAMSQNKTLLAAFQKTLRGATGSKLRAQLDDELQRLKTNIEDKSEELFGSRNLSLVNTETNIEVNKAAQAAEAKVLQIEERLAGLGDRFKEATDTQVGTQIQNLIQAKSELVRKSLGPQYDKVISEATAAGAKMPAQGVESIYKFVVQNNLRDIFGKTSEVDKQIMGILKPQKIVDEPSSIIIPNRAPTKPVERTVHPEMSFEQVDSLKRRINALERDNKGNPDALRKLKQLEEVVDAQRELIGGPFNQQLKDVDKLFYERMGIPFDNKSIKDLNTKGYAEQVAPVLLSKPSATRQFLETVGPEGQNVVKTAIMSKLYEAAVRPDGTINQPALERNIKKYSEVIDQVDGLQEELVDIVSRNSDDIVAFKAAVDQRSVAQADIKAAEVLKKNPNLQISFKAAATNLAEPSALNVFNEQLRLLDADTQKLMQNRLRREVIAQATERPNALEHLTDPNNRAVLSEIMGGKYVAEVNALAKLSDAIKRADPENTQIFNVEGKFDPLFRKLGVSSEQAFSVARDRIMSIEQKIAVLLSKANAARMRTAEENALMEVFLDPDGLPKLLAAAREQGASINKPEGLKKFLEKSRNILGAKLVQYSNGSIAREVSRQQAESFMEEQARIKAEMDAKLPEGFQPLQVEVNQGQ